MLGYLLLFISLTGAYFIKDKKGQLLIMFIILTLFSGLRYGIGYDYYSYLDTCIDGSYRYERFEFIPQQFVMLSQKTFPYLFFVLSSVFIMFFYYMGIRKGGRDYYNEAIFYICFPFLFFNQLGIIRQAMASAVVFYAMTFPYDVGLLSIKQYKRLLLIGLAFLCHHSALVAVLILFPWYKLNKYMLWMVFIISFFAGVVLIPFFETLLTSGFFGEELAERALRYIEEETAGEGKIMKYLIYLVAIMSLILYDRLVKTNSHNAYYIGLVVFGAALYAMFVFNSTMAKRFSIFFFSAAIFVVPQIVKVLRVKRLIYVSAMIILFVVQIYISSFNIRLEDTNGSSVSYPYQTFLEKL